MTEDNGLLTRRTVLRSGAGAAALGAVGAGALFYGSQPALALDSSTLENEGDLYIQEEDDEIVELTITPEIDLSWENFDESTSHAYTEIDVTITSPDENYSEDAEVFSTEGDDDEDKIELDSESDEEITEEYETIALIGDEADEDWEFDSEDLFAAENEIDGDSDPTEIKVEITVIVDESDEEFLSSDLEASASTTFDLYVREGSDMSFGGDVVADGENTFDHEE